MARTRFVIVDDHPLFRGALRQILDTSFGNAGIEEAGSLDELMPLIDKGPEPDIIFLDLAMPGVQGLAGLMALKTQYPALPVVVVSANDDRAIMRRCLEFGASGYVPKSEPVENIRRAAKVVMDGGIWAPEGLDKASSSDEDRQLAARLSSLTPQQLRVLGMLSEGLLNKQIAYKLGVSEATVKAHVSAILQKLGVDSRTQAVIIINKIGLGSWQKAES